MAGRLSTTTGWPRLGERPCAIRRDTTSLVPPGSEVTMRMVLFGYAPAEVVWPNTVPAPAIIRPTSNNHTTIRVIGIFHFLARWPLTFRRLLEEKAFGQERRGDVVGI